MHCILEVNNFQITVNTERGSSGLDLHGAFGHEQWAIDVKYYLTVRAQPTLIL